MVGEMTVAYAYAQRKVLYMYFSPLLPGWLIKAKSHVGGWEEEEEVEEEEEEEEEEGH